MSFPALLVAALGAAVTVPAHAAREERGNLILDGVTPASAPLLDRIAPWLQTRDARFESWLPDGSMLVTTRFGDIDQLHRVAGPLGTREQLTFGADPVLAASGASVTGGTQDILYVTQNANGEPELRWRRAADGSVAKVGGPRPMSAAPMWLRNGKTAIFQALGADGLHHDLHAVDATGAAPPRLIVAAGSRSWRELDAAPDGVRLLVQNASNTSDAELYFADINTGGITPVVLKQPLRRVRIARFAPDGRGLHVLAQAGEPYTQLLYADPVTGEVRSLSGEATLDLEDFAFSADSRWLALVANRDGVSRLSLTDQIARLELQPPVVPAGAISDLAFDPSGQRLAFTASGPDRTSDAYVFEPAKSQLTRWTQGEIGAMNAAALAIPELVRFPTWDRSEGGQRQLPALYYRPRTAGPHPVLVLVDSGPGSQSRPHLDEFVQVAVNGLGYAVIVPSVRGTDGFGAEFAGLDTSMRREDATRDIGSLLVWIGLQRDLDRTRVVVMGRGQGAQVALSSLAQYSDRLVGGISVSGTTAWNRIPNAKALKKPLLVIHGGRDLVAPLFDAERIVASARGNGADAALFVVKDEAHVFRRKSNRDAWIGVAAAFLERAKGG